MSEILKKLGRKKSVLAAAEAIPEDQLIQLDSHEGSKDPHVWFDVQKWKYVVKEIGQTLQESDTVHAGFYETNMREYLLQLDSLDDHVRRRLKDIPEEQRILITAHDAFAYFGEAYDLRVEGLQGLSTVADFGLRDITDIIDIIIKHNIKSIFTETSVSDKSINAVIAGCREKNHDVGMAGALYSDAMGTYGTPEGTYIGMFKKNVETIVEALK